MEYSYKLKIAMKLLSTPVSKSIVLSDDESCKIPTQKDNSGKVLSTDGTNLSWINQTSGFNLSYDKYEEVSIYLSEEDNEKEYKFQSKCLVLLNGNYFSFQTSGIPIVQMRLDSMPAGKYLPTIGTIIVNKDDILRISITKYSGESVSGTVYFSIIPLESITQKQAYWDCN